MYVQHNTGERSCNHCCSGKAIGITYSECVALALIIQPEMNLLHFVICGLTSSTKFFYTIL